MTAAIAVQRSWAHLRRPGTQKVLALSGILTPIVFFLLLTVAGLLRPGYNPVKQYGSELEAGPNAWLIHLDFVVAGLLQMAFSLGMHRGVNAGPHRYRALPAPGLMCIGGVGLVIVGIFNGGTMHYRGAKLLSWGLMASYVLFAPRLRRDPRWQRYAPYCVIAAVLAFVLWAAMNYLHSVEPVVGLVQRSHYLILFGWTAILAQRLLRLTAESERCPAAAQ